MSEMDVGLSELPDGWVCTTLGEIIEPSKERANPQEIEDVPYISLEHIEKDTGNLLGCGCSSEVKSTKTKFKRGDLLYGKLRPYLNKVYLSDFEGICSTDILVFPKNDLHSNEFLLYRLLCPDFVNYASHNVSGVNLPRVNFQTLAQFKIPLPPLPEQHRIVAKIEELFTKLDAGIDALHKVGAQLKRYRQTVLKAAFEGKLTEAWRAEYQDEIEPASVLLARVLKERRERWEAEQLELMKAKGKIPKDDKWKTKYKEPAAPDTSGFIELATGWTWVKLEQVTHLVTKGSSPRWQGFDYVDDGITFLRSQNVGWGMLDLSNVAYLPETFNEKEKKSILKEGDVLLNLVGASIGRVAIASDELEGANMNQAVALIRLVKDGLDNRFLMNYLISPNAQSTIHGKKVDVARANLSLTDVSEFATPLPSPHEQQAIVSEIERRLSVADEVEKTVTTELKRAEQLRQSILRKAFSGKLVPQDPNDEPASLLLERIRAENRSAFQHTTQTNGIYQSNSPYIRGKKIWSKYRKR